MPLPATSASAAAAAAGAAAYFAYAAARRRSSMHYAPDAPLLIQAMHGLGDALYQRPFVRAQSEVRPVYISTPWPEMYADLPNVHFVKTASRYRTQTKNLARHAAFPWAVPPQGCEPAQFTYSLSQPGSICEELERHVGLAGQPFIFDAPDFGPSPVEGRYAVIRPVSFRSEWRNTARNCDPAYISQAARLLKARGYTVVCVADLAAGAETLVGEKPEADIYWTAGELDSRQLFALVQHAAVVVGAVGWIVPTTLAYRTPAVIVAGGLGAHNAPHRIVDRRMDASRYRQLLPEPYCARCRDPRHECRKGIPDFEAKFGAALAEVTGACVDTARAA